MRAVERHRQEVLSCSRCFPDGDNFPVVDAAKVVKAMLVGQAPGITEVTTRAPFTGPAGRRLEAWFERAGVSREEIFFSALARCFPGKAAGGGDKPPSKAMMSNCRPHLDREFALLEPRVVIPVGGMAIKELLGITRLVDAVGLTFERDGVVYVPLPHPSGASTWLNAPENKARLDRALAELGTSVASLRAGADGRLQARAKPATDRS
jgi:uracil-DNA glycosylase